MKIVIDIPDGRYEELMTDDIHLDVPIFKEDIIATLPKGHGRIIDISQLEYLTELNQAIHGQITWQEAIKRIKESAPTIIETDTGSEGAEP